jgi:hypothetical protein
MIRNTVLLTIFFLCAGEFLYAQEQRSGMFYFLAGIQDIPFNYLNEALTRNGFAETPTTFGSGSGGFGKINRWRVGGEGVYFFGSNSLNGNKTKAEGGLGYFYGGYEWGKASWKIVPALGFGLGGLTVSATRTAGNLSIDQLLTTNPNSTSLSNGGTFMHSSVMLEKNIAHWAIALKGVYNASLSSDRNWKANENTVALADAFGGFSLTLSIGFWLM